VTFRDVDTCHITLHTNGEPTAEWTVAYYAASYYVCWWTICHLHWQWLELLYAVYWRDVCDVYCVNSWSVVFLIRDGFRHVLRVRPDRGPTNWGCHRPENVEQCCDIFCGASVACCNIEKCTCYSTIFSCLGALYAVLQSLKFMTLLTYLFPVMLNSWRFLYINGRKFM